VSEPYIDWGRARREAFPTDEEIALDVRRERREHLNRKWLLAVFKETASWIAAIGFVAGSMVMTWLPAIALMWMLIALGQGRERRKIELELRELTGRVALPQARLLSSSEAASIQGPDRSRFPD